MRLAFAPFLSQPKRAKHLTEGNATGCVRWPNPIVCHVQPTLVHCRTKLFSVHMAVLNCIHNIQMRIYLHTCIHALLHTVRNEAYMRIHAYLHICILHAHVHTIIHAHIHTHLHIHRPTETHAHAYRFGQTPTISYISICSLIIHTGSTYMDIDIDESTNERTHGVAEHEILMYICPCMYALHIHVWTWNRCLNIDKYIHL